MDKQKIGQNDRPLKQTVDADTAAALRLTVSYLEQVLWGDEYPGGRPLTARRCPVCGSDSMVYDSRETSTGTIRRNRRCLACGTRFVTEERLLKILTDGGVRCGSRRGNPEV